MVMRWSRSTYLVTVRCTRLVPGWVIVFRRINCLAVSTLPGHPSVGRLNEYLLRLGRYHTGHASQRTVVYPSMGLAAYEREMSTVLLFLLQL